MSLASAIARSCSRQIAALGVGQENAALSGREEGGRRQVTVLFAETSLTIDAICPKARKFHLEIAGGRTKSIVAVNAAVSTLRHSTAIAIGKRRKTLLSDLYQS